MGTRSFMGWTFAGARWRRFDLGVRLGGRAARIEEEIFAVLFGQRFGAAEAVADHVGGAAGRDYFPGPLVENLVAEFHRSPLRLRHPGAHGEKSSNRAGRL